MNCRVFFCLLEFDFDCRSGWSANCVKMRTIFVAKGNQPPTSNVRNSAHVKTTAPTKYCLLSNLGISNRYPRHWVALQRLDPCSETDERSQVRIKKTVLLFSTSVIYLRR
jgi:hypothetical protein